MMIFKNNFHLLLVLFSLIVAVDNTLAIRDPLTPVKVDKWPHRGQSLECSNLKKKLVIYPKLFRYSNFARKDLKQICGLDKNEIDELLDNFDNDSNNNNEPLVGDSENDVTLLGVKSSLKENTVAQLENSSGCESSGAPFKFDYNAYYLIKVRSHPLYVASGSTLPIQFRNTPRLPIRYTSDTENQDSHWRFDKDSKDIINRKHGLSMTFNAQDNFKEYEAVYTDIQSDSPNAKFDVVCEGAGTDIVRFINTRATPPHGLRQGRPDMCDGSWLTFRQLTNIETFVKPDIRSSKYDCTLWKPNARLTRRVSSLDRRWGDFTCESYGENLFGNTANPQLFELIKVEKFKPRDAKDPLVVTYRDRTLDMYINGITGFLSVGFVSAATMGGSAVIGGVVDFLYNTFVKPPVETQIETISKQILQYTTNQITEQVTSAKLIGGVNEMNLYRQEFVKRYNANKYYTLNLTNADKSDWTLLQSQMQRIVSQYESALTKFLPDMNSAYSPTPFNIKLFQTVFGYFKFGVAELLNIYQEAILLEVYLNSNLDCAALMDRRNLQNMIKFYRDHFEKSTKMLIDERLSKVSSQLDYQSMMSGAYKIPRWQLLDGDYFDSPLYQHLEYRNYHRASDQPIDRSKLKSDVPTMEKLYKKEIEFDMVNWSYDWNALKFALDVFMKRTLDQCTLMKTSKDFREKFVAVPDYFK